MALSGSLDLRSRVLEKCLMLEVRGQDPPAISILFCESGVIAQKNFRPPSSPISTV